MFSNRLLAALSGALFALGFACLTQAQVPMTGAGRGTPGVAATPVAFDANGTLVTGTGIIGSCAGGINVSGNGLAILTTVVTQAQTVLSAVWDVGGSAQSMTFVGAVNTTGALGRLEIWALIAPTSGTKTLQFTLLGSSAYYCQAISFSNVNQGSVALAFPNFNSAQASAAQTVGVNVTSSSSHLVIASSTNAGASSASSVTGTQVYSNSASTLGVIGGYDTGAGTKTMTANYTAPNDNLAIAGVDVSN